MLDLRAITDKARQEAYEAECLKREAIAKARETKHLEWLTSRQRQVAKKLADLEVALATAASKQNTSYEEEIGYNHYSWSWEDRYCVETDPIYIAYQQFAKENNLTLTFKPVPRYDYDYDGGGRHNDEVIGSEVWVVFDWSK